MYKYNIHTLLRKLPVEDYEQSWKFFPDALCISKSTWKRWIYLKQNAKGEINSIQLIIIANFFNVTVDELINKPKTKINIRELFVKFKNAAL